MVLGLSIVPQGNNLCLNKDDAKKREALKFLYLVITTVQFGLLCGLRHKSVAYDTGAYEILFNNAPNSWSSIFKNHQYIEFGFSVFCSLIKLLGGNFQVMLVISSLFIMGSCCVFIYRHSPNVVLSVFTIICFPFYYSSFDIIRHFMALSFILLGYKHVKNKKLIRFLIYVLIGSLFHKVALVFIALYFIDRLRFDFSNFAVITVAFVVVLFSVEFIVNYVGNLVGKESAGSDGWVGEYSGGVKTAIMYFGVFILSLFLFSNIKEKKREHHVAMINIYLLFGCSVIFLNARIMIRFVMSFVPFLAIGFPKLLPQRKVKAMEFLCVAGYVVIGILYHAFMLINSWQNVVPYIPFWA